MWCEILILLEHQTLRTCAQVSKRFNALVMSQPFDSKLFRGPLMADGEAIQRGLFQVNPALEVFSLLRDDIDDVTITKWAKDKGHCIKLADSGAAGELATLPGVKIIGLQSEGSSVFEVKNECGVTVFQVAEAMCALNARYSILRSSLVSGEYFIEFERCNGEKLTEDGQVLLLQFWLDDASDNYYDDHFLCNFNSDVESD